MNLDLASKKYFFSLLMVLVFLVDSLEFEPETLIFSSLENFSSVYKQKSNYQIKLNKYNDFEGNLFISYSKIFFLCEELCNLLTLNSVIHLENSYFSMQKIMFNISQNDRTKFNYVFNLTNHSILSLQVIFFFL